MHLKYNDWATLIIRLYNNQELETEWIVGPIPDQRFQFSREVIVRYQVVGDGISPSEPGRLFLRKRMVLQKISLGYSSENEHVVGKETD